MKYENFINFNQNITELKDSTDSVKIIKHIINNKDRKTGQELINPKPEMEQINIKPLNLKKIKKDLEGTKELKKGGKGAKPYKFITSTLNVEPIKENEALIKEWGEEMVKLYSKYFNIEGAVIHTNETRPGLHIVAKWYNKKEWGNFVNGKKVKLSGAEGKATLLKIWKEGEAINKRLAEKYKKEFRQEATTEKGRDRTIQRFRAMDLNTAKPEDLNKLINWLIKNNMIKTKAEAPEKVKEVKDKVLTYWGKKENGKFISIKEQLDRAQETERQLQSYKNLYNQTNEELKKARKLARTPEQTAVIRWLKEITGTKTTLEAGKQVEAWLNEYNKMKEKELQNQKPKSIGRVR